MTGKDISEFVIRWNNRFPVDHWWRKKFNIAFNSRDHRKSSFLDQLIEYEEDKLFNSFLEKNEYIPGSGDWLKLKSPETVEESIQQLREEFKDI